MTWTGTLLLLSFFAMVAAPFLTGDRSARGLQTYEGFAVGRRDYSWFAILAGLATTYVGGSTLLNIPSLGYTYGWYALAHVLPLAFAFTCSGIWLVPRIRRGGGITVGTLLHRQGPSLSVMAGLMSMVVYTLLAASQVLAATRLLAPHLPIPKDMLAPAIAVLVASYVARRGYSAVTLTDRLQFVVIAGVYFLPLGLAMGAFSPTAAGGEPISTSPMSLDLIALLALPMLYLPVSQDLHVRIHSSRSVRAARLGAIGAGIAYLVFGIASTTLGVTLAGRGISIDQPDEAVPRFLEMAFGPLAAVPTVALLAAIISSLDSGLFAASASISYDVAGAFRSRPESGRRRALVPQLATLLVLGASVVLAVLAPRILALIIPAFVIYVAVMPPVMLGVWLRMPAGVLSAVGSVVLGGAVIGEIVQVPLPFRAFVYAGGHALLLLLVYGVGRATGWMQRK